jgi:DNA-binding IclR family transcriptional regulator
MARPKRSGTQAVERAVALMRAMAERNIGWRISTLAEFCGLEIATTHRLLACLIKERIVVQRPQDRRYVLGPLIAELALSRPLQPDYREPFLATMAPIARKMDAASFLYLRSDNEYVVAAQTGPLKSNALSGQIGARRPLAWTAGGLAMLMAMPKGEARSITRDNMAKISSYGSVRLDWSKRMLRESKKLGCGINTVNVGGIHIYAVPIRNADGDPVAAVSLAVSARDFPRSKSAGVIAILDRAAQKIAAGGPAIEADSGVGARPSTRKKR